MDDNPNISGRLCSIEPGDLRASFVVSESESGTRLDKILETRLGFTRGQTRKLVGQGRIRSSGRAVLAGSPRYTDGTRIEILSDHVSPEILPENLPIEILKETDRFVIINKPAKMAVHPGPKRPAGTLANALRGLGLPLSTHEGPMRPGIVHRLDVGTSGAMIIAKDNEIHAVLAKLFAHHAIHRCYLALVLGHPAWEQIYCDQPLSSKRRGRKGMRVFDSGRTACTHFRVISQSNDATLIEAQPETGRTHQIRVHLAYLGFPIIGDTLYGGGRSAAFPAARLGLDHPALHAQRLGCRELDLDVTAPFPEDFVVACARLSICIPGMIPKSP